LLYISSSFLAAFGVNSEPHTGARPSVRLCVSPELVRCVHIGIFFCVAGKKDIVFSCGFLLMNTRRKLGLHSQPLGTQTSALGSDILCVEKKTISLVKTPRRHRVGFEPQRASSFLKWVKAP
jgi:hypothetical protein